MSPSTDSSDPRPPTPVELKIEADVSPILENFRQGIILKSKFRGWKSRMINLNSDGFSERQIKAILNSHPEYDTYQVLTSILVSEGEWTKCATLYSIPKPT